MIELLHPVGVELRNFIDGLPSQCLGKNVHFHAGGEFDKYDQYKIAIIGVGENRGAQSNNDLVDITKIRKNFYALYPGNWDLKIVDLGDVLAGEKLEDTYYLLKIITAELISNKVIPIVLGGSQDLTYALYRAYEILDQMVNLVVIDSRVDIAKKNASLADSFLSKIIIEEPINLFNYANLGYQTYFNSQEEIDLIDSLYFEAYRVGEISNNLTLAEPVLRDADIVSIDLNAVKSSDSGNFLNFNPNGFDGKEICGLARYSGLSDKVSVFGIFNYNNQATEALLISQVLWYFIEGVNCRYNEYPFVPNEDCLKYIVPFEDYKDLVFYKSNKSERWWIEVDLQHIVNEKLNKKNLLPCSYDDYLKATSQQLPDRWWRTFKKSFI